MSEASSSNNYVTPLPAAFAEILQRTLNEQLRDKTDLLKLTDKVLALELKGTGITLFFQQIDGQFKVSVDTPSEVATWIRGTPKALFGMAKPEWSSTTDQVTIEGDAGLVRDFEAIMRSLDFDWEQKLSGFVGDVAAHQVGIIARKVAEFAKRAVDLGRESGKDIVSKSAQNQAGQFTSTTEFSEFSAEVKSLSDSVTELETSLSDGDQLGSGK